MFYFLLSSSCGETKEEDPKDFSKIVPRAQSSSTNISEKQSISIDTLKIKEYSFLEKIDIDSVLEIKQKFIPDRFNPIFSKKETIFFGEDSIQYISWRYKDSIQTKRALFNLMDCFEEPCKPFKLKEVKNVSKFNFLLLQNNTDLIVIKSTCDLKKETWLKYLAKSANTKSFNLIVEQKKRGKLNWYFSKNQKILPLN